MEYENTFTDVNAYISGKIKALPKRYRHYLGEPMNRALNRTYKTIMEVSYEYIIGKKQSVSRYRKCAEVIDGIREIIKLSYTYWILSGDKNEIRYITAKQRAYWAELVNREISLINGVMAKCRQDKAKEIDLPGMEPIMKHDFSKAVYIEKIAEMEQTIYKRAIQCGKDYTDAQMEMLVSLSRDALYYACEANRIRTDEGDEARKKRRKYLTDSISALMAMNRPIRELAFDDIFTEKELEWICERNTDAQKIMRTLRDNLKDKTEPQ